MLNFAHRGASHYAPENTLAAFQRAVEMGAQAIELDVTLSKDGHIIVVHDDTITRYTGRAGAIKDFTLAQLQTFDVGSWYSADFSDQRFPTLEQVLTLIPEHILINIELKHMPKRFHLPRKVYDLIIQYPNRCCISSFNPIYIYQFSRMDQQQRYPLALLYVADSFLKHKHLRYLSHKISSINIEVSFASQKNIDFLHQLGYKVYVYTVNRRDTAELLAQQGADGIFSNLPDLLY